jgi:hypothetical protein
MSYKDFDSIINDFGYTQSKNGFLHNYFDWSKIEHWFFQYEVCSQSELHEIFANTEIINENVSFLVRLKHRLPLIQVTAENLVDMLEDLCYETGMGWEAVSSCGRYIIEFTDSYEYLAKCNFVIESTKHEIKKL